MRWVWIGLIIGGIVGWGLIHAQSLPQNLIYGRTSGSVNVPIQVQSDGTVVVQ